MQVLQDRSSNVAPAIRAIAAVTLCVISITSCTNGYNFPNHLGVLPPQPPSPLWMGAIRPAADSVMHGAAAVSIASTPHWSHLMVSIEGARPAAEYSWRLRSGRCSEAGAVIGPEDRYTPLIAFADGTATSQTAIPETLTPSTAYSVTIANTGSTGAPVAACADLAYGSM